MPQLLLPWSAFNALGRSRVVRSSYAWVVVVPIVAKLLSGIQHDFRWPIFGSNIQLILGVPFTWELLYYAAVTFSLATLTYQIFCPEIVKAYDRYSDFSDQGKGSENLVAYAFGKLDTNARPPFTGIGSRQVLKFLKLYSHRFSSVDPSDAALVARLEAFPQDNLFDAATIEIDAEKLSNGFWHLRDLYDRHLWLARLIVQVFYAIGFALVSWIMVQNFVYVAANHIR